MRIFTLIDYYLPGHKSGGPVRSLEGITSLLPDDLEFWILTNDRDFGDSQPYPGVTVNAWTTVGRAKVFYAPAYARTAFAIAALARGVAPDVVYANGLYSRTTLRYLAMRYVGLVGNVPVVIAPRGELSPGALEQKHYKKTAFLKLTRLMHLFRNVVWQASTEYERRDIQAVFRSDADVWIARDMSIAGQIGTAAAGHRPGNEKRPGAAKLVFLSRITPMKNLEMVLDLLRALRGEVELDIYGPVDDEGYWSACQKRIEALRDRRVTVRYRGAAAHEQVFEILSEHDFLVLPTHGENFGHVLYESLTSGCPVVTSDRTPWRGLAERGAGWDLPLDPTRGWVEALQACIDMGPDEYGQMSMRARAFAAAAANVHDTIEQHVRMFRSACRKESSAALES